MFHVTIGHLCICGFIFFVPITVGKILGKLFMLGLVTELVMELWVWVIGPPLQVGAWIKELVTGAMVCKGPGS